MKKELVTRAVALRKDQADKLKKAGDGSKIVREALDEYWKH